jgi:hypothetical protein
LFKKFRGARGRKIEGIKFLIAVDGDLEYLGLGFKSRISSCIGIFHIASPICSLLIVMDKWKVDRKLNRICFMLTFHMEEWYTNVVDIRWYLIE